LKMCFRNLELFWCVKVIAKYVGDCGQDLGTSLRNSCVEVLGSCSLSLHTCICTKKHRDFLVLQSKY